MKITDSKQLRSLYDLPNERAKKKQLTSLDTHAINFIKKSPFLVLSTFNQNGEIDASPRGGQPGFVQVTSDSEIIIPDSKGNNRIDSLVNIVESGRVGTLFLIPGMDETLRVNGRAYVSIDPEHLNLFSLKEKPPKTVIVFQVEEVFLHCAKALMRSKLWMSESQIDRSSFPTMGQMLKEQLGSSEEVESQEAMLKRYQNDL